MRNFNPGGQTQILKKKPTLKDKPAFVFDFFLQGLSFRVCDIEFKLCRVRGLGCGAESLCLGFMTQVGLSGLGFRV